MAITCGLDQLVNRKWSELVMKGGSNCTQLATCRITIGSGGHSGHCLAVSGRITNLDATTNHSQTFWRCSRFDSLNSSPLCRPIFPSRDPTIPRSDHCVSPYPFANCFTPVIHQATATGHLLSKIYASLLGSTARSKGVLKPYPGASKPIRY